MPNYKTPGAYIEEVPAFPPSVVPVATAVPAFIGYTHQVEYRGKSLINVPTKINSLADYVEQFGTVKNEVTAIKLDGTNEVSAGWPALTHRMYYSLQLFFKNGGKDCYIVAVGPDSEAINKDKLISGLEAIAREDEPTILVFPDAIGIRSEGSFYTAGYYELFQLALEQCYTLKDRVVLIDVPMDKAGEFEPSDFKAFRDGIGASYLKYGIAYYPDLETTLNFNYDAAIVTVSGGRITKPNTILRKKEIPTGEEKDTSLFHSPNNDLYNKIVAAINARKIVLPASVAMAGVLARVDRTRGVHIAPANVSVIGGKPTLAVDDEKQRDLNMPSSGKSINVIRPVTGRGKSIVWGARTLDGSSNEWRYINVRRYFNYAEQSIKQSTFQFVFEPNNKNTWERARSMIVNFLTSEWGDGALAGKKPEEAFFVNVGLGTTMSATDVLEGKMIFEIGMAVVRPAEFIILRFSHKMQET